jgi:hypothetical protein
MNLLMPRNVTWNFDEAFDYVIDLISHKIL